MKRVTGIGGIFLKAKDPKALGDWYRTDLGIDVEAGGGATCRGPTPEAPQADAVTGWSLFPESSDYFAPSLARFMVNYRVEDLAAVLAALRADVPAAAFFARLVVSYPLVYHYLGAARHFVWDLHKIGNQADKNSLLEVPKVERSSKLLFASSAVLGLLRA